MPDPNSLRRMEDDLRDLASRVATNERALAALPYMTADIMEIKDDCAKTRAWVEQKIREQRAEEQEERKLSASQWAAVIGGVFLIGATIIQLIATLVQAGGHG